MSEEVRQLANAAAQPPGVEHDGHALERGGAFRRGDVRGRVPAVERRMRASSSSFRGSSPGSAAAVLPRVNRTSRRPVRRRPARTTSARSSPARSAPDDMSTPKALRPLEDHRPELVVGQAAEVARLPAQRADRCQRRPDRAARLDAEGLQLDDRLGRTGPHEDLSAVACRARRPAFFFFCLARRLCSTELRPVSLRSATGCPSRSRRGTLGDGRDRLWPATPAPAGSSTSSM